MSQRQEKELKPHKLLPDGKFDLDQWNEVYWNRFRKMLEWTYELDIIVQIEVWDRFDYSRDSWVHSPWNPANNINYTFEETGLAPEYPKHPADDLHPFFHSIKAIAQYREGYHILRSYQRKFVAKMLSYTLQYSNVLYCMNNETTTAPAWGRYWIRFIKECAARQGAEVYVTDMFDDGFKYKTSTSYRQVFDAPDIYTFLDISQINGRLFGEEHWNAVQWFAQQVKAHPRPLNHTKIYGSDDSVISWVGSGQRGVERFVRNIIGGSASSRFHRGGGNGNGLNSRAKACIAAVRKVETMVKFWDVEPRMELLLERSGDEVYVAADEGEKYILYYTDGGSADLDLRGDAAEFALKWVDVNTGQWGREITIARGGIVNITAPSQGGWLAAIVRKP